MPLTCRATSSPLLQASGDSSPPNPGFNSNTDDESEDSKGEKFFNLCTLTPAQLVPSAALTHVTAIRTALPMSMPCGKLVTQGNPKVVFYPLIPVYDRRHLLLRGTGVSFWVFTSNTQHLAKMKLEQQCKACTSQHKNARVTRYVCMWFRQSIAVVFQYNSVTCFKTTASLSFLPRMYYLVQDRGLKTRSRKEKVVSTIALFVLLQADPGSRSRPTPADVRVARAATARQPPCLAAAARPETRGRTGPAHWSQSSCQGE